MLLLLLDVMTQGHGIIGTRYRVGVLNMMILLWIHVHILRIYSRIHELLLLMRINNHLSGMSIVATMIHQHVLIVPIWTHDKLGGILLLNLTLMRRSEYSPC